MVARGSTNLSKRASETVMMARRSQARPSPDFTDPFRELRLVFPTVLDVTQTLHNTFQQRPSPLLPNDGVLASRAIILGAGSA